MRCWRLVGSVDEEGYEYCFLHNRDLTRWPSPAATWDFAIPSDDVMCRQRRVCEE